MAYRYYYGVVKFVFGHGFVALFPDLPDFRVVGDSVDAAKEKAEAELTPFLHALADGGKEVPLPHTDQYVTIRQPDDEFRILIRGNVPNETPLSLIRENTKRLCRDARLLYNMGSLPSCVTLSIAAIEEAGKFVIHYEKREILKNKGRLGHETKQAILGEVFDTMFLIEALDRSAVEYEAHLREIDDQDSLQEYLALSKRERMALIHQILSEDKSLLRREIKRQPDRTNRVSTIVWMCNGGKFQTSENSRFTLTLIRMICFSGRPSTSLLTRASIWLERAEFAIFYAESIST
jgi:AbiV family abortive infection protein